MNKTAKILERPDYIWHSKFYDYPIDGLCRHNGNICYFWTHESNRASSIYELTIAEKCKWLASKKLFEICVGYHCSYPQGEPFKLKRPAWLWKLVFKAYYRFTKN